MCVWVLSGLAVYLQDVFMFGWNKMDRLFVIRWFDFVTHLKIRCFFNFKDLGSSVINWCLENPTSGTMLVLSSVEFTLHFLAQAKHMIEYKTYRYSKALALQVCLSYCFSYILIKFCIHSFKLSPLQQTKKRWRMIKISASTCEVTQWNDLFCSSLM